MTITVETRLQRDETIIYAPVKHEAVMLNIDQGRYHSLNEVGARIWELLESPQTVRQLCHHLCDEFDVEESACHTAVLEFVRALLDRGMVHAEI